MFGGLAYDVPTTGKKILGLPNNKAPQFQLGWDQGNQMNDYQLKRQKNKEVTTKITSNLLAQSKPDVYSYVHQPQVNPQYQPQQQYQPYQPTMKDYERLVYENPDVPPEELEKMLMRYDEYRGVPSRNSKNSKGEEPRSSQLQAQQERRTPIKPRESMRDIIYNGVGVGQQDQRAGSRRNNPNYKADSYNYYPPQ